MDTAKAVQAHLQFPLTITSPGGTVTGDAPGVICQDKSCTIDIDAGNVVTLQSTPDSGGSFVRWEDGQRNPILSQTDQITMDTSQQVTAIFAFPLTTQINN